MNHGRAQQAVTLCVVHDGKTSQHSNRESDPHWWVGFAARATTPPCSQRSDASLAIKGCSVIIKSSIFNSELKSKAYNNRGNAFDLLGKPDKAIDDYSKAIELIPHYSSALFNRGHSLFQLGRIDSAILDLNRVISLKPELAVAYKFRGDAYQEHGRLNLALKTTIRPWPSTQILQKLTLIEEFFTKRWGKRKKQFQII